MATHKATVTSKGQITIPREVRERLGLAQGDIIEFSVENGKTVVRPLRGGDNPFMPYAGAVSGFESIAEVNDWSRELRDDDR